MEERARLASQASWLRSLPVSAMVKHGWIRRRSDRAMQVKELLQFFEVSSPEQWAQRIERQSVSFRRSAAFETDKPAMAAWLQRGLRLAEDTVSAPFDQDRFQASLGHARGLTRERPEQSVPRLQSLCAEAGVVVALVPELPRCRVWGATRWLSPSKALVQLSLRYKTDDHFWFSFFHEAGHILLHGKKAVFLEGGKSSTDEERQANAFAANFLIPPKALAEYVRTASFSMVSIQKFADRVGVAPGIVVGRLQHDGVLAPNRCNAFKRRMSWSLRD
jgi:hypothetical protein